MTTKPFEPISEAEAVIGYALQNAEAMTWRQVAPEEVGAAAAEHSARSYQGKDDSVCITVVDFGLESQGGEPGSRGYDGVVVREAFVVRLRRPEAEALFKIAMRKGR